MLGIVLGTAAALGAAEAAEQPDLSWLAGYWRECDGDREVTETWSQRVGGIQLGHSITYGKQAFSWEQMRIESMGGEAAGLVFFAQRRGAAEAVAFPLLRAGPNEVVFENKAHDFPQRITYRRDGNRLTATISDVEGKDSLLWIYQAAPLNSHC